MSHEDEYYLGRPPLQQWHPAPKAPPSSSFWWPILPSQLCSRPANAPLHHYAGLCVSSLSHPHPQACCACGCPSWSIPTRAPPFPRGPDKGKGKVGRSRERGRELLLFFRPSAFDAYRRVPRSGAGGLGPRGETKDGGPATPSPRTLNCRSGGGSTELRRPWTSQCAQGHVAVTNDECPRLQGRPGRPGRLCQAFCLLAGRGAPIWAS